VLNVQTVTMQGPYERSRNRPAYSFMIVIPSGFTPEEYLAIERTNPIRH